MARVFADEGEVVLFIPIANKPADLDAATVAELTAGTVKDLSEYAIQGESQFQQADSDRSNRKSYAQKGKVTNLGLKNADLHLVAFRDFDATTRIPTADDVLKLVDDRQEYVVVKRKAIAGDVSFAALQEYEYFTGRCDAVKSINDADGTEIAIDVSMVFTGETGFGIVAA